MRKSVTAIFCFEEKIFVIERQPHLSVFPGYHSFPGGKVDIGENDEIAGVREVKEEIGVDLSSSDFVYLGSFGL